MKILNMSDLHLKSSSGVRDDFEETSLNKLEQILNIDCDIIVDSGDWLDSWRSSKPLIRKTIKLLKKYNKKIFTVLGNHDQAFRSLQIDNCSIGLLEASECLKILNKEPYSFDSVDIYGCSFGEEIPEIKDKSKLNILSIHKMIIENESNKVWYGQTEYSTGKSILKDNNFDVVFSGDNHKSFEVKYKNKVLINNGSIMRLNIKQEDHKPRVVLFDTDTLEYNPHYLDCKPFNEIFKAKEHKISKGQKNSLQELSNVLRSDQEIEIDFENIVWGNCKNEDENVKKFITRGFNE